MRQWSGGFIVNKECALTGTCGRQRTLRRVHHNQEVANKLEPFSHSDINCGLKNSHKVFPMNEGASRRVFDYEDRYRFSRIILGRDLVFDSHFEAGNLAQAFRKPTDIENFAEYDLILNHDVHSIGHTQWFYFSVSNMIAGLNVKFNIGKFSKRTSLFNQGMMPLLYSERQGKWLRCGNDISYVQTRRKTLDDKNSYILTFTHQFEFSNDKCYFAYSYPYTYSDLQDDLLSLQLDTLKSKVVRRSLLCRTLAGNRCDILTITERASSLADLQSRQGVVISARVHPGETSASWICKGIIEFLTSDCDSAIALRRAFVFKVIPMLNPDGVVNGNYRTSLAGVDLNRRWNNPHKVNHPTIYNTKMLLKRFQKARDIVVSCDIHGHSRREGLFMYGCSDIVSCRKQKLSSYIIPDIFASKCLFFNKESCTFRVQGSKASTMRVIMYHEFGIERSYTLEASLSGSQGFHFSLSDLMTMGKMFCLTLLEMHQEFDVHKNTNIMESKHSQACETSSRKDSRIATGLNVIQNDDPNGSDSNPSEDNLSESEALQMLSYTLNNGRFLTRKKEKTLQKVTKKKRTSKKLSSEKLQRCPVIRIGVEPITIEKNKRDKPCFPVGFKKKIETTEKRSLSSFSFPL